MIYCKNIATNWTFYLISAEFTKEKEQKEKHQKS